MKTPKAEVSNKRFVGIRPANMVYAALEDIQNEKLLKNVKLFYHI